MRWRKTAVVGGAALGAAAMYNASSTRDLVDDDDLGGEPDEFRWRGHRIALTRHGEGRPVLLLHGIYPGASSFEWRHVAPALAERHRVVAVDLLGFGRSDRPAARYTPGLLQALAGRCLGARRRRAMRRRGERAHRRAARRARRPRSAAHHIHGSRRTDRRRLHARPRAVGERDDASAARRADRREARSTTGSRRPRGCAATSRASTSTTIWSRRRSSSTYVRMARQPGGKHAIAALLSGKLNVDVRAALRRVRQPTLMLWGELARQNSVERAHAFRVIKHDLEWSLVQDAGDLPHDERPDEFNTALRSFLERARRWSGSGGSQLAMA